MTNANLGFEVDEDDTPPRYVIYGPGSVGKTTLACSAPSPVVFGIEDGAREFARQVPRVRFGAEKRVTPRDYREVLDKLGVYARNGIGDRKTFIFDGASQFDVLVQEHCVAQNPKWKSIATAGFGNGEAEVLMAWRPIVSLLEEINRKHRARIVITAHAQIAKFKNPEGVEFGFFDMMATKHEKGDVPSFLYGWAEVFAFARFETLTTEVGPTNRQRTVGTTDRGDRLLHLTGTNVFRAKCRISGAPETINLEHKDGTPKGWADVFGPIEDKAPERIRAEIEALLEGQPEKQKSAAAWLAKMGDDVPALSRALEKLRREQPKQEEKKEIAA